MKLYMAQCKHTLEEKEGAEPQSYDSRGEAFYGVYDMHCKHCKVELTTLIGMSPFEIEQARKTDKATKAQHTRCQQKKNKKT